MLRLYAMFAKSKKLLALIIPGFSAVIIAEIVILVLSTRAQIGLCLFTDVIRLLNFNVIQVRSMRTPMRLSLWKRVF